jgi:hypothetical protein
MKLIEAMAAKAKAMTREEIIAELTAGRDSKRIKERIESAMRLGAMADEFSDKAFAAGDTARGTYWGNRAIAYYTEAEKLSGDYLPAGLQHRG